jgi:Flp pilus assembly protein TadG
MRQRIITRFRNERGVALAYTAVLLAVLLIFTGLAVDSGRAYVVKAQLTKAVDGAALAAARNLNSGSPCQEAMNIFRANYPGGYMGTTWVTTPSCDPSFFSLTTDPVTGVNTVRVTAQTIMPTTFMKLAQFQQVTVSATGEATRRMVDLSLVLDVSSSIGSQWGQVRDAARSFIQAFDGAHDRMSLLLFSNGVSVLDQMPAGRGFNKTQVMADVPSTLPGGSTNMVEGLYRAWDELRSVPNGSQSGLRIIVLFTDGCSNSVPGNYDAALNQGRALRTWDFPDRADPDGQTHNDPHIDGLYPTNSANSTGSPAVTTTVPLWSNTCAMGTPPNCIATVNWLPSGAQSWHAYHRSSGIPTQFPFVTPSLTVDGAAQNVARPLRNFNAGNNRYPAEVWNINNAARNLVERIANDARNDVGGDYKIRIYTIGMGNLVRLLLGTRNEKAEDILKRMANDKTSLDFNAAQLEGRYFFAQTAADVSAAFQGIQNQILRLSK